MARRPLFSVVVITRNRPELVVVTLRAVQAQTFNDYEVLVLDDGSSQENLSALRTACGEFDDRFRLVELSPANAPGSGPAGARNQGIAMASGKFVAFCDDDDHWSDPRHLAVAAAAFRAHPDASLYCANQISIRNAAVSTPNWFRNLCALTAGRAKAAADHVVVITTKDIDRSNEYGHMNTLVLRRSFALSIGFWERLQYWEDGEFFLRAIDRAAKILFRSDVVANHYVPDAARASASSELDTDEKLLVTTLACKHVQSVASDPHVRRFAHRQEGDCLRRMALNLAETGSPEAPAFALQALGARFGLKWLAYTIWLYVRGRRSAEQPKSPTSSRSRLSGSGQRAPAEGQQSRT